MGLYAVVCAQPIGHLAQRSRQSPKWQRLSQLSMRPPQKITGGILVPLHRQVNLATRRGFAPARARAHLGPRPVEVGVSDPASGCSGSRSPDLLARIHQARPPRLAQCAPHLAEAGVLAHGWPGMEVDGRDGHASRKLPCVLHGNSPVPIANLLVSARSKFNGTKPVCRAVGQRFPAANSRGSLSSFAHGAYPVNSSAIWSAAALDGAESRRYVIVGAWYVSSALRLIRDSTTTKIPRSIARA